MNQKKSSEGCGGILIGAILGVVAGIVVGGILDSAFAGFIMWCFCVWVGGNIADGTFASKFNLSQRPGIKSVNVHYTNSKGENRNVNVDPKTVKVQGPKVTVNRAIGGSLTLNRFRILNPEVLGLTEKEIPLPAPQKLPPLPAPQKLPKPIKTEEGPPILEPEEFIVGDMSGTELLYTRSDGSQGVIYFDPDSLELTENRVIISPYGTNEEYAILLEKIINPEVVHIVDEEDDEPPILEPAEFIIGDMSGKELRYVRNDGNQGAIYFDPESLELTDTRAIVSPYGTDEQYAILLEKILNPEVLSPQPETPVVPQPEPLPPAVAPTVAVTPTAPPQFETGVRVIIESVPLDSYEAAQIMRSLKPDLGPFEVLEALKYDHETILQGYDELRAKDIKTDLEEAGCTINLQTIDESGAAPAVMEPKVIVETEALPEPWAIPEVTTKPIHKTGRPPTEEEFVEIRWADFEDATSNFDEIKALIESAPVDVNARDKSGIPLVFGVQSPRILGLLMDRGADIHAKDLHERSILHASEFLNPDVCKMLIQFGADIDARSEQGQTPLICAAKSGEYEVAKILIESGADIHVSPEHGRTALEEARDHRFYGVSAWEGKLRDGCAKIAALLHEHGAS